MMTLRKLVLGETWVLPLGIALAVVAAAVAEQTAGAWWRDAGGPALLVGVIVVLVVSVRRG